MLAPIYRSYVMKLNSQGVFELSFEALEAYILTFYIVVNTKRNFILSLSQTSSTKLIPFLLVGG